SRSSTVSASRTFASGYGPCMASAADCSLVSINPAALSHGWSCRMVEARALIAEDEDLMRARLREQLRLVWPTLEIVAEAADGDEAIALFEQHRPDIVFLDIRMPEKSGLDVALAIDGRAHIVFVTAYDQYALHAFDAGAVDYLLKPMDPERLARTVERLRRHWREPVPDV